MSAYIIFHKTQYQETVTYWNQINIVSSGKLVFVVWPLLVIDDGVHRI